MEFREQHGAKALSEHAKNQYMETKTENWFYCNLTIASNFFFLFNRIHPEYYPLIMEICSHFQMEFPAPAAEGTIQNEQFIPQRFAALLACKSGYELSAELHNYFTMIAAAENHSNSSYAANSWLCLFVIMLHIAKGKIPWEISQGHRKNLERLIRKLTN